MADQAEDLLEARPIQDPPSSAIHCFSPSFFFFFPLPPYCSSSLKFEHEGCRNEERVNSKTSSTSTLQPVPPRLVFQSLLVIFSFFVLLQGQDFQRHVASDIRSILGRREVLFRFQSNDVSPFNDSFICRPFCKPLARASCRTRTCPEFFFFVAPLSVPDTFVPRTTLHLRRTNTFRRDWFVRSLRDLHSFRKVWRISLNDRIKSTTGWLIVLFHFLLDIISRQQINRPCFRGTRRALVN